LCLPLAAWLRADVGDVDNARALFERVLTEDANRKSVLLWERYLAFEFEMGDLQSALRLEKRARWVVLW
jgi:cleavage stimulation factor subunit 3